MFLQHYGVPRKSGRYPYGSGKRPYQRTSRALVEKGRDTKIQLAKDVLGKTISKSQATARNLREPDSPTTVKTGSKISHVTGVPINKIRSGQMYVSVDEYDKRLYDAFLGMRLKSKGFNPQRLDMVLKRDLNAPSRKEQMEVFNEIFKEDQNKVYSDVSEWMTNKGKFNSVEEGVKALKAKSKKDFYMDFNNSLEKSTDTAKKYYDELKRRGYNAVVDEHDISGSWMQGKKPIILMDALSMVGDFKVTDLSTKELRKSLEEWLRLNK